MNNTTTTNKINFEDYFFMGEPCSIEVINEKGTSELGYLLKDNGNNTYQARISYPFGDCTATVKKSDNQCWDVFEFINNEN